MSGRGREVPPAALPHAGDPIEIKVRGVWCAAIVSGLGTDSHAGRGRVVFFQWVADGAKGAMWSGQTEWRLAPP